MRGKRNVLKKEESALLTVGRVVYDENWEREMNERSSLVGLEGNINFVCGNDSL